MDHLACMTILVVVVEKGGSDAAVVNAPVPLFVQGFQAHLKRVPANFEPGEGDGR
jgi:hypothetical protein